MQQTPTGFMQLQYNCAVFKQCAALRPLRLRCCIAVHSHDVYWAAVDHTCSNRCLPPGVLTKLLVPIAYRRSQPLMCSRLRAAGPRGQRAHLHVHAIRPTSSTNRIEVQLVAYHATTACSITKQRPNEASSTPILITLLSLEASV